MAVSKKLVILSDDEINELYGIPKLEQDERPVAFSLSEQERQFLESLSSPAVKINFILQLGYFKVSHNFYKISFQSVRDDVWFIINQHFQGEKFPKKNIDINEHYSNQKAIRELYGYQKSNARYLIELGEQAKKVAKYDISPNFIFEELLIWQEFYEQKVRQFLISVQTPLVINNH